MNNSDPLVMLVGPFRDHLLVGIGVLVLAVLVMLVVILIRQTALDRRIDAVAANEAVARAEREALAGRVAAQFAEESRRAEARMSTLVETLAVMRQELAERGERIQGEIGRFRRELGQVQDEVVTQNLARLKVNETIAALMKGGQHPS
ncbi:MAG: hypothetical protein J0H82_10400 [Alphaproteobacteria bacterium]|jgi:hypothetical protein|nr:hypothetical protein [Alphaproteobacteria bacterium]